jgi:hypothetical protein
MEAIKNSEEKMELSCLCKNKKAGSQFCSCPHDYSRIQVNHLSAPGISP